MKFSLRTAQAKTHAKSNISSRRITMPQYQIFTLGWQNFEVTIKFNSSYSEAFKHIQGMSMAHIEVKADEPLPFTETGYRSLFIPLPEVIEYGGAVSLVQSWLEEAAKTPAWKKYQAERKQLSLF